MLVHSRFKKTEVSVETQLDTRSTFHKVIVRISLITVLVLSIATLAGVIVLNSSYSAWILSLPAIFVVLYVGCFFVALAIYATYVFPQWREILDDLLPVGGLLIARTAATVFIRLAMIVLFGFVAFTSFGLLGLAPALGLIPVILFIVTNVIVGFENVYQWGINDTKLQLEEAASHPQNS